MGRKRIKDIIILLSIGATSIFSFYYWTWEPYRTLEPYMQAHLLRKNSEKVDVCPTDTEQGNYKMDPIDHNEKRKRILCWNKAPDWYPSFATCKFKDCLITTDKCDFPRSHAVLFTAPTLHLEYSPRKIPGQIFVYWDKEPPTLSLFNFNKNWRNVFNWTWSYRRDADIFEQYGQIVWHNNSFMSATEIREIVRLKSKMAAWFVSQCSTHSQREKYVQIMQQYLDVDVYGACGKFKCPKSKTQKCRDMLDKTYKFYLSFENALCRDYVTEKLFHINLRNLVVSITRGDNYTYMYMPPKSYIDTKDFSSVKELTSYMMKLFYNETEYLKYYRWRKYFKLTFDRRLGLCKLCEKLHNLQNDIKFYDDIRAWKNKIGDREICQKPSDLN